MTVEQAYAAIRARAGCPGVHHPIFFASTPTYPPTLQRVDNKGRPMKNRRRGGRARGDRRVVVGRAWLEQHMPEVLAAFVVARMMLNVDAFPPPVRAHKGTAGRMRAGGAP